MLTTIMSCFAQTESESISKNVAWGIRQSFKNGNVPMRYGSLLGYRKGEDGKPEIIPEEAEIVREIFRSYLDGMSLAQIADTLNLRGITTKLSGAVWKGANVQNIPNIPK
ncbi:MAG: recombinase family protein [Oscillospiraceae bacterium]|nr:recombinase family protein [Oscillospiraceae bacterium]